MLSKDPETVRAAATALKGAQHGGGDPFGALFGHVVPHGTGYHLFGLEIYNIQYFQVAAIAAIFLAFLGVARAVRTSSGGIRTRVLAGWVNWIRDEMVFPYMDESHGRKLLPLFLSVFFFVLFMNLFGLVPGGATATASVFVTAALATITFLCMVIGGMVVQGPIAFWKNLLPHGIPAWMVPLMFLVELIGLVVKPFALTVRLFANMLGGHLVLLSFLGLILYFGANMGTTVGLISSPAWVGMAVFVTILEGFVALLQAYIFTLLSIIFVGMSLHPEH